MTNARILLMRHAEKSADPMDPHLSSDGYARAAKLAEYVPDTLGVPSFYLQHQSPNIASDPLKQSNPFQRKSAFRSTQHTLIKTTAPWPVSCSPTNALQMRVA